MSEHHLNQQLSVLLNNLTQALKQHNRWQDARPDDKALSSTQPFCYDSLSFEQWLQFILIERFEVMIANEMPLPRNIAIIPMAEDVFDLHHEADLLNAVADIDSLLSGVAVKRTWLR